MKNTKRFIPFVVVGMLLAALTGCNQGGGTNTQKKAPQIEIALTDNQQFNENEFVEPQITVTPSTLEKTVTYYKGQDKLNAAPQTVGDYVISVATKANAEYKAGEASKNFLIRKVPVLSFYSGDTKLEDGAVLDTGSVVTVKASVEGVNPDLKFYTAAGALLDAMPTSEGIYSAKATVARTATIGSTEAELAFELRNAAKETSVVTFYYKGVEAAVESHWVKESYNASVFYPDEFNPADITYSVYPSEATYIETIKLDEEPISEFPNPLTKGVYAIAIDIPDQAVATEAHDWILFEIVDRPTKTVPTIEYYIDGTLTVREEGVNCIAGNWPDSTFTIGSVPTLSFTVDPVDEENTSWWFELNETNIGQTMPTEPGTYAYVVHVNESETHEAAHKWVLFVLVAPTEKTVPTIEYYINGTLTVREEGVNCIAGNWPDSTFTIGSVPTLSFTVDPVDEENTSWWFELNEVNIGQTMPTEPGTYAYVVHVDESETHASAHKWVLFVLVAPAEKTVPTIEYYINGTLTVREEGVNCIAGNWPDSTFKIGSVPTLSFTVDPVDEENTSWWFELNETNIGQTMPTEPGTYAYVVHVDESETHASAHKWVLFVLEAAGQDPVTLDKIGSSITSEATSETEFIVGNYILVYNNGKKQGDALLLTKGTGYFYNKTPMPAAIKSVTVYTNSGASNSCNYDVEFSATALSGKLTGSNGVVIAGGSSQEYTCSVENALYFCISVSAKNGQVLKVVVNF